MPDSHARKFPAVSIPTENMVNVGGPGTDQVLHARVYDSIETRWIQGNTVDIREIVASDPDRYRWTAQ